MRSMKPAVAKGRRISRDGAKRRHGARARGYARWRRSSPRRRSDGATVAGFIASGVTERSACNNIRSRWGYCWGYSKELDPTKNGPSPALTRFFWSRVRFPPPTNTQSPNSYRLGFFLPVPPVKTAMTSRASLRRRRDFRPDSRHFLSLLLVGTRALATPLLVFSMTYRQQVR